MKTYEKIQVQDLKEIRKYALVELNRLLHEAGEPKGKYVVYGKRLIAICLCQGAAQHFVDKKTGFNDIDVWFFFKEHRNVKIPDIRNMRKLERDKEFKRFGTMDIDFLKKRGLKKTLLKGSNTLKIF